MKKLLLSCALAILAALPVLAYDSPDIIGGGTNGVPANSTNTYNIVIPVTQSTYVSLQPIFALTGAGTSSVTYTLGTSVDGNTFKSGVHTITRAAAGTVVTTDVTNILVGAIGFLRLETVTDGNATAITNLSLKVGTKRNL